MPPTRRDALLAASTSALAGAAVLGSSRTASAAATGTSATTPTATATPAPTATGTPAPTASATPTPTPTADPYPLRLSGIPVRDPFIVSDAASGLYRLYAQNVPARSGTPGVGTMVYRSPDLKRWSAPQAVFVLPAGSWATQGGWAPEVHRWKGRWVLFTTVANPTVTLPLPKPNRYGLPVQIPQFRRGVITAVADTLDGPFSPLDPARSVTRQDFMALDGTLYRDRKGKPWMVYAHEWVQKIDGTIEAVPLTKDLSATKGAAVHLFKGSDATWIGDEMPRTPTAAQIVPYVTDGPELIRLPGGALAMLWSTFEKKSVNPNQTLSGYYVQTYAVSASGSLYGPWEQREPLVRSGSGHGMVFTTLPTKSGRTRTMLVLHHGTSSFRARLYDIALKRTGLVLGKHRTDLDAAH